MIQFYVSGYLNNPEATEMTIVEKSWLRTGDIAYFDEDGSLIAVGRFISGANMPLLVSKSLAKKYEGYQVLEVIEYVQGNETSYLVTLENEKNKLIVNAFGSGNSYVFKKEKKNSVAKL